MTGLLECTNMDMILPHSTCIGPHDQQRLGAYYGDEKVYTDCRLWKLVMEEITL